MKKITALLLTLAILFAFAACDGAETVKTQTEAAASQTAADTNESTAAAETQTSQDAQSGKRVAMTGWGYDEQSGTLTVNEQQYVETAPDASIAENVRTLVITGSAKSVPGPGPENNGLSVYPNLQKIVVGDGVTKLGNAAFDGCFKTEEIALGSGVREIAENAFYGSEVGEYSSGCVALKRISVSAENANFTAQDNVLYNKDRTELLLYPMNRQKTEYVMPDSVKTVNWFAFGMNQTLEKLTVGKGIRTLEFCLLGCNNLHSLILPDTLTAIGDSTVKMCGLRSVTIPDSVKKLGMEAFAGCDELQKIHIGKGVTLSEDDMILFNSPALKEVTVDPANPSMCTVDGVLFTKDRRTLLLYLGGLRQKSYSVPDGTEKIAYGAFSERDHLEKIFIPASVREIESDNISFMLMTEDYDEQGVEYPYTILYAGNAAQWKAITQSAGDTEGVEVQFNAKGLN